MSSGQRNKLRRLGAQTWIWTSIDDSREYISPEFELVSIRVTPVEVKAVELKGSACEQGFLCPWAERQSVCVRSVRYQAMEPCLLVIDTVEFVSKQVDLGRMSFDGVAN